MSSLAIDFADVGKDVSSALGIPIVAPVLTLIFSTVKKIAERQENLKAEESELNRSSLAAHALASKIQRQLTARPNDVSQILNEEIGRLHELLADVKGACDKYSKRSNGRFSKVKLRSAKKALSEKIKLANELREDLQILAAMAVDARLCAIQQSQVATLETSSLLVSQSNRVVFEIAAFKQGLLQTQECTTRDNNGYRFFYQEDYEVDKSICYGKSVGGPKIYTVARLRPSGLPVIIRRFPKRDERFFAYVDHLKQLRSGGNLTELMGYSRVGDPFVVMQSGIFQFCELNFRHQSWQEEHLVLRSFIQVISALSYLSLGSTHLLWMTRLLYKRTSNMSPSMTVPIFDYRAQIKLDPDLLSDLGFVPQALMGPRGRSWWAALNSVIDDINQSPAPTVLASDLSNVVDPVHEIKRYKASFKDIIQQHTAVRMISNIRHLLNPMFLLPETCKSSTSRWSLLLGHQLTTSCFLPGM